MIRIFCDFDGTVSLDDIGEQFFRTFAEDKAKELEEELISGRLTVQDWLVQLCEAIPTINQKEFDSFAGRFSIDPYFKTFVRFSEKQGIDLMILSDGLDSYIERVLANSGLNRVKFFANHIEFIGLNGKQKLAISFPHTDAECNLCGNCKRNHILNNSADEDIIIYVGDGCSDRCPARYADFVFAKGQLIKYCQQQNITFFEFRHFGDVQSKVEEILLRKRIRHRQEAAMARREAFMQG
jgi:2-hydroxy-3-keto-5-methylthiopentenyl-1-phosphate phosphatase